MNEMTMIEIDEVSGAIIGRLLRATYAIAEGLYGGGMYFYNSGRGDEFLYAVQGGNMGA